MNLALVDARLPKDLVAIVDLKPEAESGLRLLKFTFASSTFLGVLGIAPQSLLEKSLFDFVHDDDIPRMTRALTVTMKSGYHSELMHRMIGWDGRYRWFECSSQLIDEKKFILFVLRDVSKGKHVVGTFLRESSTSTAHCVIIMSVIGQKMLIQETQGDVAAIVWRKSATLLDSDYLDMVPPDDHEVIRTSVLRLRQGQRSMILRHHIYAKGTDNRPCVELVEVNMCLGREDVGLVFVISNVTKMVLDQPIITKDPALNANKTVKGAAGSDTAVTPLLNSSPFLGLGADCLHARLDEDSRLDNDDGNANELFDDFFDADEEKQQVVSLNPLPRSGSMDNKTSPFGLEDVFGDDQSSNDEEDEVFASGDIGFTKDAGADPESGSGGDVDCGGYTDAEFPVEHPIDAFIEGDISTVNTDTVHTDVDLVENKQEVKEEEEPPVEHPIDAFIEGDISTVNTDMVHTDVDLVENKQEVQEEEEEELPVEHPIDAFVEGDISTVNTVMVHTDVDVVENKQEVKEEEELTKMLVELDAEELLSHEAQAQSASGEGGEADADAKGDVVPDVMVKEVNTEVKEGAEAGVNQSEPETDHANKRQKVE